MQQKIQEKFRTLYNAEPVLFKAPGRINLIGEHTDYNDGFVFPAAIDKCIFLSMAFNHTEQARLYAYDLEDSLAVDLNGIEKNNKTWANYILGVIDEFHKKGLNIKGFDCVFGGNIPHGAGLSSSAALETVFTFAFNHLHGFNLSQVEMIKMAQMAEVNFVGVNCGIMDQFISFSGQKNKALKLDCRSLDYDYTDIHLDGFSIMLADTLVKHSLASGEYNIRRQECETGVKILQSFYPNIKNLRDVNLHQLEQVKASLSETVYNRCRYVIEENQRVQNAARFLENNMTEAFGQELFKTHKGLSELYNVSCEELDFLVELATQTQGVVGARMMGGGFGGCTLNIVKTEEKEDFKHKLSDMFNRRFGHCPKFYDVKIEDGAEFCA